MSSCLCEKVSFVIPALNEENYLPRLIASIKRGNCLFDHEIIVVDNGSTDSTVALAKSFGSTVLKKKEGSIASLRNLGAKYAKGQILVFLDADVELEKSWFDEFPEVINEITKDKRQILGSHCVPVSDTFLDRYWYSGFKREKNTKHFGSAHMIIHKDYFFSSGGFNDSLITGEDYDLCTRIVESGGKLVVNENLKVLHHRNPESFIQFISKQGWHGIEDWRSFGSILKSKVSIITLLFIMLHFLQAVMWYKYGFDQLIYSFPLLMLLFLLLASSYYKFKHCGITTVFVNSIIFYAYYVGRVYSLFRCVFKLY